MKTVKSILIIFAAILMTSCAKFNNRVDADGGLFGSYNGDWIVVTYSGNHITDVWKLTNAMVQSEEHSDGWLFVDANGNAVHVGGNSKAIRVNDKSSIMWDQYVEYHSEHTNQTYQQFVLDQQREANSAKFNVVDTSEVLSIQSLTSANQSK